MANKDAVKIGPGLLYAASLGAVVPTDLTTAWATVDPLWVPMGYTEEGHEFSYEPSFEPVTVAEELDPLFYEQTGREQRISFAAAEITVDNFKRAFNGGSTAVTGSGAAQVTTFRPPLIGSVTKLMIGWESQDHKERYVIYQALQVGNVTIARRKAPDKATIPMEFRFELPDPLVDTVPYKHIFSTPA